MELWLDRDSPAWNHTLDAYGKSWVDQTEEDQERTRGKVYFRRGLWPGEPPGIATVSAGGVVRRPTAQKASPIERSWEEDDGY
jgi:hypothetical protein